MVEVICDTSFLIVLATKPLKKFDELENEIGKIDFVVPSLVIKELGELLRTAEVKRSKAARQALELANKFKTIQFQGTSADEAIIDYASKQKCLVATIDDALRNKLKSNGITVITLTNDKLIYV
ncbi:MAG: PIN domain-containing protein [Nitrososphaerales archaeon]